MHNLPRLGLGLADIADACCMDSIDHSLLYAVARLQSAIPDPMLWAGSAANSCAVSIEGIASDLLAIRQRLSSWAM